MKDRELISQEAYVDTQAKYWPQEYLFARKEDVLESFEQFLDTLPEDACMTVPAEAIQGAWSRMVVEVDVTLDTTE